MFTGNFIISLYISIILDPMQFYYLGILNFHSCRHEKPKNLWQENVVVLLNIAPFTANNLFVCIYIDIQYISTIEEK